MLIFKYLHLLSCAVNNNNHVSEGFFKIKTSENAIEINQSFIRHGWKVIFNKEGTLLKKSCYDDRPSYDDYYSERDAFNDAFEGDWEAYSAWQDRG